MRLVQACGREEGGQRWGAGGVVPSPRAVWTPALAGPQTCNLSHQGVDPAATRGELVDALEAVGWEHGLWGTPKLSLLLPISVWNLLLSWCSCLTLPDPHHGPQGLLPRGPREASGKPPLSLSSCSGVIRALLPRPPS